MRAILRKNISDWTGQDLPPLKKGALVLIHRLEQDEETTAEYVATANLDGESVKFEIQKSDFDVIN